MSRTIPADDPRLIDVVSLGAAVRRCMSAAAKSDRASYAAMSRETVWKHHNATRAHMRNAIALIEQYMRTGKFAEIAPPTPEPVQLTGLMASMTPFSAG